jgi:hypothetical protein
MQHTKQFKRYSRSIYIYLSLSLFFWEEEEEEEEEKTLLAYEILISICESPFLNNEDVTCDDTVRLI